jgi:hypothetical protein
MLKVRTLAVGVMLSVSLAASQAAPARAGSFSDLAGSWSGGGTLTRKDGTSGRLRCQARYDVTGGGDQMNLRITCASDSFKFDLTGFLSNSGGLISGQFNGVSRTTTPPDRSMVVPEMGALLRTRSATRFQPCYR